jgi:hypothetical protein
VDDSGTQGGSTSNSRDQFLMEYHTGEWQDVDWVAAAPDFRMDNAQNQLSYSKYYYAEQACDITVDLRNETTLSGFNGQAYVTVYESKATGQTTSTNTNDYNPLAAHSASYSGTPTIIGSLDQTLRLKQGYTYWIRAYSSGADVQTVDIDVATSLIIP